MAFLRLGDESAMHPQVMRMQSMKDARQLNEAFGWVTRCATMAAAYETDFFVSEATATLCGGARTAALVRVAVRAGVFGARGRNDDGDYGWLVNPGEKDELWHMLLKAERQVRNDHKGLVKRQDVRVLVRLRDGDQCRFCGTPVSFKNRRKGNLSATYAPLGAELDHVDPATNDPDEVAVACWPCNARKGQRTPEEAGMVLLDAPERPWYRPETVAWLAEHGYLVAPRTYLDADLDAPAASGGGGAEPVPPGRDAGRSQVGPGRVGAGPGLVPPPRDDGNVRSLRPAQPSDDETPEAG